jgi:ABC-type amino acid transport substrate-binding protein
MDVKQYDTQENANLDLGTGRLDLLFADMVTLASGFLNRPEGADFEIKGLPINDPVCMGDGIGIAVRKEDKALTSRFNAAIKAIVANGTYKKINEKYFTFDLYGG